MSNPGSPWVNVIAFPCGDFLKQEMTAVCGPAGRGVLQCAIDAALHHVLCPPHGCWLSRMPPATSHDAALPRRRKRSSIQPDASQTATKVCITVVQERQLVEDILT
jgi:hypothetical protein